MSINKSLSALGDVIFALSTGEKFVPYRNNKLTQVMQDSLGGNAKVPNPNPNPNPNPRPNPCPNPNPNPNPDPDQTLMFVNISPADYNADETVSSLNFAARCKLITNDVAKQAESAEVIQTNPNPNPNPNSNPFAGH